MKKEIIYTDASLKKLESVTEDLKKRMERDIYDSKYYLGEENIEITASDIEDVYRRIRIMRKDNKSFASKRLTKLIIPLYFFTGIFIMLFGMFYEQIQYMIYESPKSLLFILVGFLCSLVSGIMYLSYRQRENERREIERKMNQKKDDW